MPWLIVVVIIRLVGECLMILVTNRVVLLAILILVMVWVVHMRVLSVGHLVVNDATSLRVLSHVGRIRQDLALSRCMVEQIVLFKHLGYRQLLLGLSCASQERDR